MRAAFAQMGFQVFLGREVESDEYNFTLLNIPPYHPARDSHDTFYTTQPDVVLRTHTSPAQVRVMRQTGAPLRAVVPGACFRNDQPDASHNWMFFQMEGFAVGPHIHLSDLLGAITGLARLLLGDGVRLRFRSHYFPFTEPSLETDVQCTVCGGAGCRLCKGSGWVEVIPGGMIHPTVLRNGGLDLMRSAALFRRGRRPDRRPWYRSRYPHIARQRYALLAAILGDDIMKVSLNWLRDYVDITMPLPELAERLALAGLEVGAADEIGAWWDRDKIVVGEIREIRPHPDADRLVLADVLYGGPDIEQCVTGAPNLFQYKGVGPVSLKVAFAMEGAELYDGHQEGFVKTRLKRTKIRGIPSRAMVCSEKELGISDAHEGIMILPADAPVGMPLADYLGDTVWDIDLTPNLARCLNMIGVAREVAALTGSRVRYSSTAWQTDGPPAASLARVRSTPGSVPALPPPSSRMLISSRRPSGCRIGPQSRHAAHQQHRRHHQCVMLEQPKPLHALTMTSCRPGQGVPTIIIRRARPGES